MKARDDSAVATIVITIGISRYQQDSIPCLPAAEMDAIAFARSLRNWGIPESNIHLFLNESATHEHLESFLEKLSQITSPFRLIFYFCGHGHRSNETTPKSNLILYDSILDKTNIENGYSLDSLPTKLQLLNTSEIFLFIDACHSRINQLKNPNLILEVLGQKMGHKSFFGLLSSGIDESYETDSYGYFTDTLLKCLVKFRNTDVTPSTLTDAIQGALQLQNLPRAEMYDIGTQTISFNNTSLISKHEDGFVSRPKISADFQDALIQNRGKIHFILGEKGLGKTTFARNLASDSLRTFYFKISGGQAGWKEELSQTLAARFTIDASNSLSLLQILAILDTKIPALLLLIDITNIHETDLAEIINFKINNLYLELVFICSELPPSTNQKHICKWMLPPFTFEEAKHLCLPNPRINYLASRGNPYKMQEFSRTLSSTIEPAALNQALLALHSSTGFIERSPFCATFKIEEKILEAFENLELIHENETGWHSHPFLDYIAALENSKPDKTIALKYWSQQLEKSPFDLRVSRRFIKITHRFGMQQEFESYFKFAIKALYENGRGELPYLKLSASVFLSADVLTETCLNLIDYLLHWQELDLVKELLQLKPNVYPLLPSIRLASAHYFWRVGALYDSVETLTALGHEKHDAEFESMIYFHRGIAHFFGGEWAKSIEDFVYVQKHAHESYLNGWSLCMLGTLYAELGNKGWKVRNLMTSGISIFKKHADLKGEWTALNNLGEIERKLGNVSQAIAILDRALALAEKIEPRCCYRETLRNLLHCQVHLKGPESVQVSKILAELEKEAPFEWFENLQMHNSLATIYLYRNDRRQAAYCLKKAFQLTAKLPSQHIYTLANMAMLFKLVGNLVKAHDFFSQAEKLAHQTQSVLTLQYIRSEFIHLFQKKALI